jgi:hypothetical protein
MKAFVFICSLLIASFNYAQESAGVKINSLVGEWEQVSQLDESNIGKIIFYPNGTLNIIHKKRPETRVLRYRLLTQTEPLQGEIIVTPFGLGQLKDRIPFTVHFNSPTHLVFKYTPGSGRTQTISLKKVKDIAHGIVPLARL